MFRDQVVRRLVDLSGARPLFRRYAFYRSRLHVVSYPKSGRTWLRFVLGVALREHFGFEVGDAGDLLEINRLARIDRRVPSIRFSHDDNPHTKAIHELERDKHAYRSKDVVFLVRDPRDVVVSSYYQHTRRAPLLGDPPFEGALHAFLRHPVFGIETIIEFMNIWAQSRSIPRRFLLVRYEDAMCKPEDELRRVLRFAGIAECDAKIVERAVKLGSFESMQSLERTNALDSWRLRPTDPNDPNAFKVRKGKVGGYADELSASDRRYVDDAIGRLDPLFGYGR